MRWFWAIVMMWPNLAAAQMTERETMMLLAAPVMQRVADEAAE